MPFTGIGGEEAKLLGVVISGFCFFAVLCFS